MVHSVCKCETRERKKKLVRKKWGIKESELHVKCSGIVMWLRGLGTEVVGLNPSSTPPAPYSSACSVPSPLDNIKQRSKMMQTSANSEP